MSNTVVLVVACLALAGQGRRVQTSLEQLKRDHPAVSQERSKAAGSSLRLQSLDEPHHLPLSPLKAIALGFSPSAAFNPLGSVPATNKFGRRVSVPGMVAVAEKDNPLLVTSDLPRFNIIEPVHVEAGMNSTIAALRDDFAKFESELAKQDASYKGVVEALEKLSFPLEYSWNVVGHLENVKNSEPLRKAKQIVEPEVVKTSMQMEQSRAVYDALAKLESSDLSGAQRRIVEAKLRDMRLSGVDLTGEAKDEFNKIQLRLQELCTKFGNNLLDATKAFEIVLTDSADVDGLPPSALAMAAQSYTMAKPDEPPATPEAGPWRLSLDMPSYIPAMQHLKSSDIRERLYRAFITRASEGDVDNGPLIEEILKLRQEQTKLLGFGNYAEQSLASKMAEDVAAVEKLTQELYAVAKPAAERDLADVREFAKSEGYAEDLQIWDMNFWVERLKEKRYQYDDEALKPYFALPKVLDGMLGLASKLFGVKIVRADDAAERWNPEVMFFQVIDEATDEQIASFFLDPYARPGEKRGGAWMQACIGRSKALDKKPVAFLTCNGSPPVGDQPSLMTFRDAETLFHEFGHGLQHMLTDVDEGDAAGINNVEWDAVELPSQFMENWLYHKPTVDSFAVHYETGEPLPADIFEKLKGARTYQAGSFMLRQLQLQTLDMELHKADLDGKSPFDVQRLVADKYAVVPPLDSDRFLCSFHHLFAGPTGGYSAGYYSYKWAEVLSADAFAAFEEAGLDNEEKLIATGRRFRETVLGRGGSQDPASVYRDFRGKDATVDALLRHNGLLQTA